ncbi:MAG TPA: MATE family efflux transporter [Candidatus Acetothermia bacterium]|nr:MATE family efflux transporter [Candidatus Acetothermia bacterium]
MKRSFSLRPQDLTSGPIARSLLKLAWPVMLSNLFQTLYNFTDRLWLARWGPVGIAAIQLSFPLVFLSISVASGITVAGIALISQYTGAGREEEANLAAGQVVIFCAALAAILAIAGVFLARPIMGLMGAGPDLTEAATSYLQIIYLGVPVMFTTFLVAALLNGVGDTVTPMILMAGSVTMNIILDPLFIFGWGPFPALGIQGAAVATVISRSTVAVVGLGLLFSGRLGIHLKLSAMRPRWGMIRKIASIGSMASIGQTGTALGFTIMNSALARLGTPVIGAFGIGNSFIAIVLMPAMGLGQATATMVGQNLGAMEPGRARRVAWTGMLISSSILVAAAALVIPFREHLIRFFLSDPEVLRIGVRMLQLVGIAFPFMGIIQVLIGVYHGSGHTAYSMFFDLFRLWGLRLPLIYALAFGMSWGADGVWWAMFWSNLGTAVLCMGFFLSGNWAKRVIKDTPEVCSEATS